MLLVTVDRPAAGAGQALRLRPSEFAVPTDGTEVAPHGVAGSCRGRVFLASPTGSLSEVRRGGMHRTAARAHPGGEERGVGRCVW